MFTLALSVSVIFYGILVGLSSRKLNFFICLTYSFSHPPSILFQQLFLSPFPSNPHGYFLVVSCCLLIFVITFFISLNISWQQFCHEFQIIPLPGIPEDLNLVFVVPADSHWQWPTASCAWQWQPLVVSSCLLAVILGKLCSPKFGGHFFSILFAYAFVRSEVGPDDQRPCYPLWMSWFTEGISCSSSPFCRHFLSYIL